MPIRHEGGENLYPDAVWAYLKDQAASFRGDIVGANLQYDLDYLAEAGIWFGSCRRFRDVQIADPLIDELQRSYSLDSIAQRWGLAGKMEWHLRQSALRWGLDSKADLWRLPARHVGLYAEADARLPLEILRKQERELEAQDLWEVYELESRILPILVKMRRRGVRVDTARLDHVEGYAAEEERRACATAGINQEDLNRPDALLAALERAAPGCTAHLPLTEKTQKPSIAAKALESLNLEFTAIQRARRMNKIRTSFVASIRRHLVGDRIHPTFNQLRGQKDSGEDIGAAYGRCSCVNPNLQQQPVRDEELGPLWRSIYVPDEGKKWCCLDLNQQEVRMTVHVACVAKCSGAEEAAEVFRRDPGADYYKVIAMEMGVTRKEAKGIFLGLTYGMGGAKLCRTLGLPTRKKIGRGGLDVEVAGPEGERLLASFHGRYPFVRELSRREEYWAKKRGYVLTLSGRRCRFPWVDGKYEFTHKALNRIIQGSSADQTKMAMVALDEAGFQIQLQVHDECDLGVSSREEAGAAAAIMEGCLPLRVPSRAGISVEDHWGACK